MVNKYSIGTKFYISDYSLDDLSKWENEEELLIDAKRDDWDEGDTYFEVTITKVSRLVNEYRLEDLTPSNPVKKTLKKKAK